VSGTSRSRPVAQQTDCQLYRHRQIHDEVHRSNLIRKMQARGFWVADILKRAPEKP
jgi:hypothetical protein